MRQLLHNETENSYQKFVAKCDRGWLQCAPGITKCDRSLLQSFLFILYIFKNKLFTLYSIYTLQVICCCSHQLTVYCYYVYCHHIVYMRVSILTKSFCIYLIEHSSYWATTSCSTSVKLQFPKREPRKYNKQDFNNEYHSFDKKY